jgi:HEPN domain-containing protein
MNIKMAKEWLKAANDDLILLDDIITNPYITNLTAFHSQQAIEKSLKALLEYQNKSVPKIHKITKLISNFDGLILYDKELVKLLDSLYIESRYPGDMGLLPYGKPTLEDAKKFYEFANEVFDKVCEILGVDRSEIIQMELKK